MGKKVVVGVIAFLAILLLCLILWNILFGSEFLTGIFNAVIGKVNEIWQSLSGETEDIITEITNASGGDTVAW